ncbi:hypothetical protein B0H63DRAFT_451902 [Podospora didyma]|uniref:Uncharacterized protein n=1 Tax=Podospora didyma TaxID=330526 RepID=A0AAE0NCA4_9PEZI|nr:hypothetical protein B0H63DRAFT_451902 [Podospora didyma]
MSSEFGPPSLNAPLFASNKPWLWALIPVGLVVIFGGLALWLHTQRRRAEAQRQREEAERLPYHAQNRDPRVAAAASAHLLPPPMSFASSVSSSPGPPPPPAVLGAPGTRWVRFNAASTRAREEGLNELGEAPPPYEPKKSDVNLPASGGSFISPRDLKHPPPATPAREDDDDVLRSANAAPHRERRSGEEGREKGLN